MLKYLLSIVFLASVLCSCAIPQWKREYLADPIMQFDEDLEGQLLQQHFLERREGSAGGDGASGGGCGC